MSNADLERLSSRTRRHGCGKLCTPRTRKGGAIRNGHSVGMAMITERDHQSARGEGKKERNGQRSKVECWTSELSGDWNLGKQLAVSRFGATS
jgi:hypothetical protein